MPALPHSSFLVPLIPMILLGLVGCGAAFLVPRRRRPLVLAGAIVVTLSVVLRGAWLLLVPDLYAVAGPADWVRLLPQIQSFVFGAGMILMAVGALRPVSEGTRPAAAPGWVPPDTAPTYSLPPNSTSGYDGGPDHGGRP
ncbi:hypothetical protein J4H86_26265 [Spiractinospora alimapuensis]|uniref:hypothetical protein n=1 Tax=Spiractinospora alimapuensis TaxID=2820884 RepID=UPI001F19CC88|nr:hypothetical protein [Spiractinospora alimapuensis]QVQ52162.1 hypothetical protein J4H86_26265 [Spiractinospora alimapuensis]